MYMYMHACEKAYTCKEATYKTLYLDRNNKDATKGQKERCRQLFFLSRFFSERFFCWVLRARESSRPRIVAKEEKKKAIDFLMRGGGVCEDTGGGGGVKKGGLCLYQPLRDSQYGAKRSFSWSGWNEIEEYFKDQKNLRFEIKFNMSCLARLRSCQHFCSAKKST